MLTSIAADSSPHSSDNRFTVVVCNYNHTRATAFAQLLQKYHNGNWECSFQLQRCSGSHECAVSTLSLASWLEAYHKQPKCVPALNWHDTSGSERSSHTLTRHTFGVVRKLRSKPWPKVLEVLRAYFVAIELLSCDEASDDEEDEDLYPDDDEISDIDSDIDEASNDNDEDDDSEEGNAESDDSGDSGLETSDSEDD